MVAEQLVGEARERRRRRMSRVERQVYAISGIGFLVVATAIAVFAPNERSVDPLLIVALLAAHAIVSRIRFEFSWAYVTPEHLVFIPMLLLLPLPWVPFLIVAGGVLGHLPDIVDRTLRPARLVVTLSDAWYSVGPVLVLIWLAPGPASFSAIGAYALAYVAHVVFDFAWMGTSARIIDRLAGKYPLPLSEIWSNYVGVIAFDGLLTPIAIVISIVAVDQPLALLSIAPLILILSSFARERRQAHAKALELQRAYRGTVMLLSDVVEFDDKYTADHSRSVVELVNSVADELSVDARQRQELEFAAMLHDVGKIAIPKEILNKPAKLTEAEFAVMKKHTIEGQHMLDRVGGLLGSVGEIVRSCHERWDGNGYPDGLAGEQIPLAARIVFTCDAYNAMTTDRVYRAALGPEEALRELERNAGTQFDPRVVAALTRVVERFDPQAVTTVADDVRAVLAAESAITAERIGAAV